MKQLKKAISIALFLSAANLYAATNEALLASYFMTDEVKIIEGKSPEDLALAQYSEEGPTIAVVVARSEDEVMYLAEISDVGSILVVLNRVTNEITTSKQAHVIACDEINLFFALNGGVETICRIPST